MANLLSDRVLKSICGGTVNRPPRNPAKKPRVAWEMESYTKVPTKKLIEIEPLTLTKNGKVAKYQNTSKPKHDRPKPKRTSSISDREPKCKIPGFRQNFSNSLKENIRPEEQQTLVEPKREEKMPLWFKNRKNFKKTGEIKPLLSLDTKSNSSSIRSNGSSVRSDCSSFISVGSEPKYDGSSARYHGSSAKSNGSSTRSDGSSIRREESSIRTKASSVRSENSSKRSYTTSTSSVSSTDISPEIKIRNSFTNYRIAPSPQSSPIDQTSELYLKDYWMENIKNEHLDKKTYNYANDKDFQYHLAIFALKCERRIENLTPEEEWINNLW